MRQKSKSQRWTRSKKRIEYFCLPNLHRYDFHFFVELSPKTDRTVGFQGYDLRFRVGITSILAEGAVPGNRQTQWNWLFHSQSARFLSWQAQYLVNLQCCFEWYDASGQQNVAYGRAREGLQDNTSPRSTPQILYRQPPLTGPLIKKEPTMRYTK